MQRVLSSLISFSISEKIIIYGNEPHKNSTILLQKRFFLKNVVIAFFPDERVPADRYHLVHQIVGFIDKPCQIHRCYFVFKTIPGAFLVQPLLRV